MSPSSKHPATSLTPKFLHNWASSGHAFMSFLSLLVFKNTYTLHYSLGCWPPPRFMLLAPGTWIYSRWFPVTIDDARCSWVNTRVPLISCSTRSSKLLLWLSTPHKYCEERRKWCMHGMNRIFEQTPFSHIWLKVTCRKGRHIFVSLWYIYVLSLTNLTRYTGDNFPAHTHTNRCVYKNLLKTLCEIESTCKCTLIMCKCT